MKLIDKDALVAEIENIEADAICQYKSDKSRYAEGGLDVIHRIKHLLNTMKEVDLEKEMSEYFVEHPDEFFSDKYKLFAKHFFKLGISVSNKAQKGEEA